MSSLLLGLVLTSAVAQTPAARAGAEPAMPRLQAPIASGMTVQQPSAPFQKLFRTAAEDARRQQQMRTTHEQHRLATEQAAPKVVCGMVVIPADPQVDPRMIRRPAESATTMHIKKIPPAACAE